MNASLSSAIVATIVAVTVTIGVSLRRPYRGIYGQFGAFSFAIGLWHLGILLEGFADNIGLRLQLLAGSWLPAFTLKFFITLLQDKGRLANRSLRFSYVIGILGISNLFIPAGLLFYTAIPIAGIVVLSSAVALQLLARRIKTTQFTNERTKLTFVLYAGVTSLILGTAQLLPGLAILDAIGHAAVTFYVYFLYQSVVTRRLMNLVEFLSKAAMIATLSLIIASVYALLVLWVGEDEPGLWIFNTVLASAVVLILYDPIRPRIEEFTERFFLKQQYALRGIARELTQTLRHIIDVRDMTRVVVDRLGSHAGFGSVSLYLSDDQEPSVYHRRAFAGDEPEQTLSPRTDNVLLTMLRIERRPVTLEDLATRRLELSEYLTREPARSQVETHRLSEAIDCLNRQHSHAAVPILSHQNLVGVLYISRENQSRGWSTEDLVMLLEIADAISVVLEHSDAYAQQHERDRLVEIGEMATGMAHEIRNPLGSIKGAVQCLEPSKVPEEYRDFLTVILEEVDRLNGVVAQFLDYARPFQGNPEPTDLHQTLSRTLELLQHDPSFEGVEVKTEFAAKVPPVFIDPEHLKQVLLNLLKNAQEAVDEGRCEIRIKTLAIHPSPADAESPAQSRDPNRELVQISVRDNGPGIASAAISKLFLPFFTTKSQGTGLGLAISQRILQQAGGRIDVRSRPGEGATFTITLPAAENY
ncbi:MAG: ATP-binding protein [Myxococcota bacterium]|nr:ATP-binding protein [Myxococcota bacterium]